MKATWKKYLCAIDVHWYVSDHDFNTVFGTRRRCVCCDKRTVGVW